MISFVLHQKTCTCWAVLVIWLVLLTKNNPVGQFECKVLGFQCGSFGSLIEENLVHILALL
jgi:hypothetical protein